LKTGIRIALFFVSIYAALILVVPSAPAHAAITGDALFPVIEHYSGAAVGSSFLGLSAAQQNAELDSMVALGIGWIRFDFQWKNVQPNNGSSYNWAPIDAVVARVNAHHLQILGVIDYAPSWASGPCAAGTNCPPSSPALFAAFAKAAAQRYTSQGVTKWEIWDEPNNDVFWGGNTNCGAYSSDLIAAYIAIKQVNPTAGVISGGLAPESTSAGNMSPTDFLSCIYYNGGKGYFDAVGDHPYTFPQMPTQTGLGAWAQMMATSPSLRSIMIAHGDAGKRIWLTEFGAPTNGPDPTYYMSEWQQNSMVTAALNLYMTYDWAGPLFWYTFEDSGTSASTNENFFGLVRYDGSTKPAYTTLMWAIKAGL